MGLYRSGADCDRVWTAIANHDLDLLFPRNRREWPDPQPAPGQAAHKERLRLRRVLYGQADLQRPELRSGHRDAVRRHDYLRLQPRRHSRTGDGRPWQDVGRGPPTILDFGGGTVTL